jgi:hypothetical protein
MYIASSQILQAIKGKEKKKTDAPAQTKGKKRNFIIITADALARPLPLPFSLPDIVVCFALEPFVDIPLPITMT